MDVFVVSHTHWDREWYQPLGRMRQRLVALLDELLDFTAGSPFLLDGQLIVLDDYLRVRPDRAADVAAAVRSGRLEVGPWYVLADGLIPGGEALIRNLLAGRHALEAIAGDDAWKTAMPPVLYCPDSFGHPAILPELARGFGLPVVVVWRGHGGERDPVASTVRWAGRDGESVLLYHLARSGYELGASLPVEPGDALARWNRIHSELSERAKLGLALLPHGADHHLPQAERSRALTALVRAAEPDTVQESTLSNFARALQERAAGVVLPEVVGERRDSYGYTWTLQGTLSSRAAQKRLNARAERMLVSHAEPWAALALAREPGDERAQRAATVLLRSAWHTLLECHPHDTLCGCSVDSVARAMEVRLASALAQGKGVRQDTLAQLLAADPDAARGKRDLWRPALVLSNPAPRPRGGVVEVEILETVRDEPVGPGSAAGVARTISTTAERALEGVRFPISVVQPLSTRLRRERIEPLRAYPDNDIVRSTRAVVWLQEPMPAFGLLSVPLHGAADSLSSSSGSPGVRGIDGAGVDALPAPCTVVQRPDGTYRVGNDRIEVAISADGSVSISSRHGDHGIEELLGVEWVHDVGDLYTHQPAGHVRAHWSVRAVSVLHRGPLRAELELVCVMRLPRRWRSSNEVDLPVRVVLRIDAGSPLLHIRVRGVNRARDHRLRLRIGTGVTEGAVTADAAFIPVARRSIRVSDSARVMEAPPSTAPLHRYVTLRGKRAVTLVSDGLAEYEAAEGGDVFVTLVRAVGALSRSTLGNRPGHAGWPARTPLAQSKGLFAANFAILLHQTADPEAIAMEAERAAEDVLVPPRGSTWRWLLHEPNAVSGFALEGDGLVLRAIMPVEGGVQLRCANILDRAVQGKWRIPSEVRFRSAERVRLDGTRVEPLREDGGTIIFTAAPYETVTVQLHLSTSG